MVAVSSVEMVGTATVPNDVEGLVVAKAPVAGKVKTRLGADVGAQDAARLAAAALLDTLSAYEEVFPEGHRHVAMTGDLAAAVDGEEIRARLEGWTVHPQRGDGLGERLANAHADVAAAAPGHGVVQVAMDTPHATGAQLLAVARAVERAIARGEDLAVLGPAEDGGWWVLGLTDPRRADVLTDVPMSTDGTGVATAEAFAGAGFTVQRADTLRDVDTVPDADAVAAAVPTTRFARLWHDEVRPTLDEGRD